MEGKQAGIYKPPSGACPVIIASARPAVCRLPLAILDSKSEVPKIAALVLKNLGAALTIDSIGRELLINFKAFASPSTEKSSLRQLLMQKRENEKKEKNKKKKLKRSLPKQR